LVVIGVRRLSRKVMSLKISSNLSKSKTIASLTTSVIVFTLYFSAFGLILHELGVSITAYLASASILGLAIGFGSQGLVQDVVNGLTIVFSGLFNVEDMVEIAGQVGIVRNFGMRFTLLENSFGAMVYIPNRTITNVVRYPKGYIRGIADITVSADPQIANQIEKKVTTIVNSTSEQLSGILVWPPSIEGRLKTASGKEFLRVKFRLWPGRGAPIETIFKQEVVYALKALDPNYQDWMVTVNYEVERKSVSL
jgi:small-conductance mechanosensitive channel